jgi:hypothetical protein
MDVPAGPGSVDYAVPDSFNGTLRVVAMAVDAAAIGVTETKALVRGPFVVQPTIPYFAAPGDEVDVTARVTNTLDGSGPQTAVDVAIETSPGLEVVGEGTQKLVVPEGRDAVAKWRLRVTGHPGVGRCTFRATSGAHSARVDARDEHPAGVAVPDDGRDAGGEARRHERAARRPHALHEMRDVTASGVGEPARPRAGARALPRRVPARLHGAGREQGVPRAVRAADSVARRGARPRAVREGARDPAGATERERRVRPLERGRERRSVLERVRDALPARSADARIAVPESTMRRALAYFTSELEPSGSTPGAAREGVRPLSPHAERAGEDEGGEGASRRARRRAGRVVAGRPRRLFLAATFQQLNLENDAQKLLAGVALDREVEPDYRNHYDALTERGFVLYLLSKHFPARAKAIDPSSLQGSPTSSRSSTRSRPARSCSASTRTGRSCRRRATP